MAIPQKLHTKLVQKLILTPSLQQAIKLLPMSTLELSDLLNQEMVENPMLEEVPTEDLQPAEAAATPEKAEAEQPEGRQDRHLGRPGLRVLLRRLPRRRLPAARAAGSQGAAADREHALDRQLALRSPAVAALAADRRRAAARDRRAPSSATSTTTGIWWPRSTSSPRWARGRSRTSSARSQLVQGFDPDRRRRARPAGMPAAAAPPPRPRRHADREDRHRAPAAAAEPPGAGDRRASSGMPIDDLKEHIEIIRHLDPKPGSRFNPTQSQYVIPDVYVVKVEDQYVARAERGRPAADAHQPGLPPAARQGRREQRRDARLREGQVPLGAVADQVGRAAAEDDPQGRHAASSTSSATSSITASSTCGRWCCATWPTTSACTSRRSAAW